ncbi:MAG: ABC transporter ATP-binding protein, partial [Acidobacteriaceae bacterium]|nr:ABC transporter ATP-binding protein [Acidobacteriaceae bacterium]
MAAQEEEVLGKAYDSRLMRRLLVYLRPYKWQVAVTLVAIVIKAAADVVGPLLMKVEVDKYLAPKPGTATSWLSTHLSSNALAGIAQIASLYIGALVVSF